MNIIKFKDACGIQYVNIESIFNFCYDENAECTEIMTDGGPFEINGDVTKELVKILTAAGGKIYTMEV